MSPFQAAIARALIQNEIGCWANPPDRDSRNDDARHVSDAADIVRSLAADPEMLAILGRALGADDPGAPFGYEQEARRILAALTSESA